MALIPASLSIDMDPLHLYSSIYGLAPPSDEREILQETLSHWLSLCDSLNVKATFFLLGSQARFPKLCRLIEERGHEVGNHTLTHPYTLSRLGREQIIHEVKGAHEALTEVGIHPVGFRAPGYHLSATTLEVLRELGYRYSSSQLPSPAYMGLKALYLAQLRLRGRQSQSINHPLTDLLTPSHPYCPDAKHPYREASPQSRDGFVEIPIGTGRLPLGLPAVGLFLFKLPLPSLYGRGKAPLVLNYHGIDLLPDDVPLPKGLRRREQTLKIPFLQRKGAIRRLLQGVTDQGYRFMPLSTVANVYSQSLSVK